MARGKPDYHRGTVIEGKYGDNFVPIVVDEDGQMFIALTGQQIVVSNHPSDYFKAGEGVVASGEIAVNNHPSDYFKKDEAIASITSNVTVNQQDSDRVLKGTEGANKRYIAVDAAGIILARLKGAEGATLRDVAVDSTGILLSRLKGSFGGTLKDISVDTDGKIVGVLQGDDSGTKRTLYVDSSGKLIARVQGVGGGVNPLFTVDDGGDEDTISDWLQTCDGLAPVDLEQFGSEGSHAMKLEVDASKSGYDYGLWNNNSLVGDMSQYTESKIYLTIYISSVEYLATVGECFQYNIGNDISNRLYFNIVKSSLSAGWNVIELDLGNPTGSLGSITWSAIDFQRIKVISVTSNTHDYYLVLDLIVVVQENPQTGNLLDVAVDKDGLQLNKLVGAYGQLHKPIACDRHGNLRVNITDQGFWSMISNTHRGGLISPEIDRNHPEIEDYTLIDLVGPGIVLGGLLYHGCGTNHPGCYVAVTIDGATLPIFNFATINTFGLNQPWEYIPHEKLYDVVNHIYQYSFPHAIPFATQFKVVIGEATLADAATKLILYHALA